MKAKWPVVHMALEFWLGTHIKPASASGLLERCGLPLFPWILRVQNMCISVAQKVGEGRGDPESSDSTLNVSWPILFCRSLPHLWHFGRRRSPSLRRHCIHTKHRWVQFGGPTLSLHTTALLRSCPQSKPDARYRVPPGGKNREPLRGAMAADGDEVQRATGWSAFWRWLSVPRVLSGMAA